MQAPAVDIGVHPPLRSLKCDGLTLPDKLTQRFALNQNPRPAFHRGAASGVAANSSHPATHCTAHAPGGRLAFDGGTMDMKVTLIGIGCFVASLWGSIAIAVIHLN